jgi:hypothetical protein
MLRQVGIAVSVGIALAAGLLASCDDQDDARQAHRTARHAARPATPYGARLGLDWRLAANVPASDWGFAASPGAAVADPLAALRSALDSNMLPPRDSVPVGSLIARLVADTPPPDPGTPAPTVVMIPTPWNDETLLLWITLAGMVDAEQPGVRVEFDPRTVAAFRPIGDPAALPVAASGPEHATMLYELAIQSGVTPGPTTRFATLRIRFAGAGGAATHQLTRAIGGADRLPSDDDAPAMVRFAAAVAGFGDLLRGDPAARDLSCDDVIALARAAAQPDPTGFRAQLIDLMVKAEPLIDLPASEPARAAEPAR